MAKKTLYVTKDMKDPLYRTRMLRAGQPVELDGPTARLYLHLGVVTDEKPRSREVRHEAADVQVEPVAQAKPKRTRRKQKPA